MTRSRPSFRPRPIESGRPLPIIRSSRDLKNEDAVVAHRGLPEIQTGVEAEELEEIHLREALLASMNMQTKADNADGNDSNRKTLEIPIPMFRSTTNEERIGLSSWKAADQYLRSTPDENLRAVVEYEADHTDKDWQSKIQKASKTQDLSLSALENIIDKYERQQAKSSELLPFSEFSGIKLAESVEEETLKTVYKHWIEKRRANGRAFLRDYQPETNVNNLDPALAFRPREFENSSSRNRARSNTVENFRKLSRMRTDMDKLREVVNLMLARENCKKEAYASRTELLKKRMAKQMVAPKPGSTVADAAKKKKAHLTQKAGGEYSKGAPTEKQRKAGIDNFFYDEAGQKFLKHMRYFAGGFAAHGVSPYDHRVFAAASERNTVRENPREPRIVDFPEQVKFCTGGKTRRPIRVRGRVGRGGRIIFDRVAFEPERGVKAASYPASITMGGCYSGSLPFERLWEDQSMALESRALLGPFEPLVPAQEPDHPGPFDVAEHWPSKRRRVA